MANALVCKTSIRGFDPRPVLQILCSIQAFREEGFVFASKISMLSSSCIARMQALPCFCKKFCGTVV